MYIPVSWIFFGLIILFLSVKIVRQDERLIVTRLGRFLRIAGPGLVWIIPIIDKSMRINLDRDFPGWQVLSPPQLEERIKSSISTPA